MSRKNLCLHRGTRGFMSRYPAHCLYERPRFAQGCCSGGFSLRLVWPSVATMPIGPKRLRKRDRCLRGNHGSIRGSWPIAISDYPRGHSVKIGDSLPRQTRPSSLTDTRPRIERLQNPTDHHWGRPEMENRFSEMLKLLADLIVWRRSPPLLPDG
jgi:hypothetical protein